MAQDTTSKSTKQKPVKVSYEEMKTLYQHWLAHNATGTQASFFKAHGWSRVAFFDEASSRGDHV